MAIVIPIIHTNGDRASTLIDALRTTYKTLRTAQVALRETAPNARNFYLVQGIFDKAVAQHRRRIETLIALQQEVLEELEGIEDQTREDRR